MIKRFFSLFLIIVVFLSTSCWDTRDLGERTYISAIGIDKTEEGNTLPLKVSVEVINPALLKSRTLGGFTEKPTRLIYTTTAPSIPKALDEIQTRLPHPLTLSHLRVLLVGEELSKENFYDVASYFEKNPQIARRLRLMFVEGREALDILQSEPKLEPYIAKKLVSMTNWERDMPLLRFNVFTDFLRNLRAAEGRAFGTRILLSPVTEEVVLSGGAVFNDWKLVGFLNGEETKKANWLVEEVNRSAVLGRLEDGFYTYRVDDKKLKIEAHVNDGQISFQVFLNTNGRISQEQGISVSLDNPKNIQRLEGVFSQAIKEEIESALHKSQKELQVDYLAFSMVLLDKDPDLYNSLDWDEVFPQIPINVEVKAKIGRLITSR